MLSKTFRTGRWVLGGAVLVALASCGGHDDGQPPAAVAPTADAIPASASKDVAGFIAFLKVLVVTQPETTQPLDTTGFVAPMDDTALPDPSI